jgi:AmiR/NasT family two-component response regulator
MIFKSSYVLLLSKQIDELHGLASLLGRLNCDVQIADSVEQAVFKVSQSPPCLMILHSNEWSEPFLQNLRTIADADSITLVVLTDCHVPRWAYQDQNSGFDGFLVKPLSSEVLSSLVQSASARQWCSAT